MKLFGFTPSLKGAQIISFQIRCIHLGGIKSS
jgi:hypothetical protein